VNTEEFDVFEEREERFQALVGVTIPRLHAGPVQLIRDITELFRGKPGSTLNPNAQPIYILSNPAEGFVYPSALQELQAAAIVASGGSEKHVNRTAHEAAARFGLNAENLLQPITTLSGGESVKLSLAKAYILRAIKKEIVVSSPLAWLSADNRHLFDRLVADFGINGNVTLLVMKGENEDAKIPSSLTSKLPISDVRFTTSCEGLCVELSETVDEHGNSRTASFNDWNDTFQSPCLMLGENGSGKSLFCKILSGAQYHQGAATVRCGGKIGRARLVFQDAISQTMARDQELLLHEVCCSFEHAAEKIQQRLSATLRTELARAMDGAIAESAELLERLRAMSLLTAKLNLIAYRLSSNPPLLILDEPDWGLSRDVAIALVIATTTVAHEHGIPVLIVSHKPWWRAISNSILRITRMEERDLLGASCNFEVSMTKELL
jgi:energy-coupling factor transporter ATP-binding protein EcfA2